MALGVASDACDAEEDLSGIERQGPEDRKAEDRYLESLRTMRGRKASDRAVQGQLPWAQT